MYYCVAKFTLFDIDEPADARSMSQLTSAISKRFKVVARPMTRDLIESFSIVGLFGSEEIGKNTIEEIAKFAELKGVGRIDEPEYFLELVSDLFNEN